MAENETKNNTLKSMLTSIDVIITRREESKMHDRARYSLAHIRPQIPVIISAIFSVLVTFEEIV